MKKVEIEKLPVLSGANIKGRERHEASLKDLEGFGQAIGGYSAREGDTIEFPDTVDDVQVFTQAIRPAENSPKQRLIVVNRTDKSGNKKADYFSLGCLSRRDFQGNPANNHFAEEMAAFDSDKSRVEHLVGKTIKCVRMDTIKTYVFDAAGVIDRSKTQDTRVPVFEYVN